MEDNPRTALEPLGLRPTLCRLLLVSRARSARSRVTRGLERVTRMLRRPRRFEPRARYALLHPRGSFSATSMATRVLGSAAATRSSRERRLQRRRLRRNAATAPACAQLVDLGCGRSTSSSSSAALVAALGSSACSSATPQCRERT
jgi:hypothetical protein